MGCDIHYIIELQTSDGWLGLYASDCILRPDQTAAERNYDFFGELAGVRHKTETSQRPRGLPDDISDLTKYIWFEFWDQDGHSHSHMTLDEFCEAYKRACETIKRKVNDDEPLATQLLGIPYSDIDIEKLRVVFWFDN